MNGHKRHIFGGIGGGSLILAGFFLPEYVDLLARWKGWLIVLAEWVSSSPGDALRLGFVALGVALFCWSFDVPSRLWRKAHEGGSTGDDLGLGDLGEKIKLLELQLDEEKSVRGETERELAGVKQDLVLCEDSRKKEVQALQATETTLENLSNSYHKLTAERQQLHETLAESNKRHWRWRLSECGFVEAVSKGQKIAIFYVRAEDRELAQQIRREFLYEDTPTPWKVLEVEQTVAGGSRINPSHSAQTIVFSNDEHRRGISRFLSFLVEDKVGEAPAHSSQEADIEIVVFGYTRSEDYY